jgi:hypothetical protein
LVLFQISYRQTIESNAYSFQLQIFFLSEIINRGGVARAASPRSSGADGVIAYVIRSVSSLIQGRLTSSQILPGHLGKVPGGRPRSPTGI